MQQRWRRGPLCNTPRDHQIRNSCPPIFGQWASLVYWHHDVTADYCRHDVKAVYQHHDITAVYTLTSSHLEAVISQYTDVMMSQQCTDIFILPNNKWIPLPGSLEAVLSSDIVPLCLPRILFSGHHKATWQIPVSFLTCVMRKQTLRSLSLSYPKKDGHAWPRPSFFGYDTDF